MRFTVQFFFGPKRDERIGLLSEPVDHDPTTVGGVFATEKDTSQIKRKLAFLRVYQWLSEPL